MENQINSAEQNLPQTGQNPVSQPVIPPVEKPLNYWMVSTIASLAILIALGVYTFSLSNRISQLENSVQAPIESPTVKPSSGEATPIAINKTYTGKNFSIDTSIWKLLSDANQSPATPEVLETVAFENSQARMNIQVGTDSFEKVLASQDGEVVGNVVIDGATATKKGGYGGIAGSVYSVTLVLAREGKTYTIGFYTQDSKNIGDYEKKFNEAVSTFKFTQ